MSTGANSLRFKHSLKHFMSHVLATSTVLSATFYASTTAFEPTSFAVVTVAAAVSLADSTTVAAEAETWEATYLAESTRLGASDLISEGTSTSMLILPRISSDFSLIALTTFSVWSSTDNFYWTADKTSWVLISLLILSRI